MIEKMILFSFHLFQFNYNYYKDCKFVKRKKYIIKIKD